jgi:hypothetical protein
MSLGYFVTYVLDSYSAFFFGYFILGMQKKVTSCRATLGKTP